MLHFKRAMALLLACALLLAALPDAVAETFTYSTAPKSSVWKTYKASLHYFYNQLDKTEKMAFSRWYDAIAKGKPEMWGTSKFDLTQQQRQRVQYALRYDCPELMYADTQFNKLWPITSFDSNWNVVYDGTELIKHQKTISKRLKSVKTVLDKIKKSKSYGKTLYDHQLAYDRYIVKNCSYKKDSNAKVNYNIRGAFSVFVTKKAVCEGYARATQLALRYFGIPCIYVYGDANNGKGSWEPHAWNMVKLGKNWYHYDPTWNDQNDKDKRIYPDYLPYFNLTDSLIGHSHKMDKEASTAYSFSLPKANSSDYEYYKKTKQVLGKDWKKKLASLISKAKKAKKKGIGIRFSSTKYYKAAYSYVTSKSRNNVWNELYRKYNFSSSFIKKMWCVSDPAENRVLYFFWK